MTALQVYRDDNDDDDDIDDDDDDDDSDDDDDDDNNDDHNDCKIMMVMRMMMILYPYVSSSLVWQQLRVETVQRQPHPRADCASIQFLCAVRGATWNRTHEYAIHARR